MTDRAALDQLARLYGVSSAYWDIEGRRQVADPAVLLAVLQALGAAVERPADAPGAIRARQRALWARGIAPVILAWDGAARPPTLRRPAASAAAPLACHLRLESGETRSWTVAPGARGERVIDGERYVVQALALPGDLPLGYHHLTLEAPGWQAAAHVLAAPRRAYSRDERTWGLFCPVYALQTERSPGSGDLTDLEALLRWVGAAGGSLVGTLPLLAAFLDTPCEPSPYVPASRLFWNELYVDPARAPELAACAEARALLASPEYRAERAALRAEPLVDYPRQAAAQRRLLAALAGCFWAGRGPTSDAFQRFLAAQPLLDEYARFRATGERQDLPWPEWPAALRDGALPAGAYDDAARRYHLYAQWLAALQLDAVAAAGAEAGCGLYLDLPLGVHAAGYDTWRERALFVRAAAGGAPPDAFFSGGQNWGFPPPHPEAMREQGYRYFAACLRTLLARAQVLRVDHIIGLHRLYWIPNGCEARQGVYVRYPAEELYAVLCLESQRHRAPIVGEDLGLVPPAIRAAMAAHGISGMYVGPFELSDDPRRGTAPVPPTAVASLNTHDLPPFKAWWEGLDLLDRQDLGLLDEAELQRERADRLRRKEALVASLEREGPTAPAPLPAREGGEEPGDGSTTLAIRAGGEGPGDPRQPALVSPPPAPGGARGELTVLHAWLARLASSPARIVLVNVEDLWLETAPQNVPGTWRERPNWRRKVRYPLAAWERLPGLRAALQTVDRLRRTGSPATGEQGDAA